MTGPRSSPFQTLWGLKPGTIFLNHGSFGACPTVVLKLQMKLRAEMEAEPVQFLWRRYEEKLDPSRAALAKFLSARARDLVFVTNSTTGVNAVVRSLKLKARDELLTTNLDYNACHNVLLEATRRAGAKLVTARVPFPLQHEDDVVDAVLRAVTKRTRLAMIDHVTSDSGMVLPIARIIRELDKRGVDTLVDGAHAPGMVPLNLGKLRPAYYTGNLHKWVCAPKGTAFLWAREDKQPGLQPPVISHGNNRHRAGYSEFQDRFDWPGTFDPTAWMCVGDAVCFMDELLPGGWAALRAHNRTLAVEARRMLCAKWNVLPPCPEDMIGSLATISLPEKLQGQPSSGKIDPEQLHLYDRHGIEVPFNRINGKRYLRVSAQIYNSPADYERLAAAVPKL